MGVNSKALSGCCPSLSVPAAGHWSNTCQIFTVWIIGKRCKITQVSHGKYFQSLVCRVSLPPKVKLACSAASSSLVPRPFSATEDKIWSPRKLSDWGSMWETRLCRTETNHKKVVRSFVNGWDVLESLATDSGKVWMPVSLLQSLSVTERFILPRRQSLQRNASGWRYRVPQ